MSQNSKSSVIASVLVGALALTGSHLVTADALDNLHKEEARIHSAAVKSQNKIDAIYEQTQELLAEYRQVTDETENLKVYNDHVARLVADQEAAIASLQSQIDSIEETKQGIVPLMYNMIDALDKFIDLDIPIHLEERKERVQRLRDLMGRSAISTSEQYRQVLEAYQIENDYGTKIRAYQGKINYQGKEITVDFFHIGRVSFVAQSLDLKNAWVWNSDLRAWEELSDEYLSSVTKAIRMARNQTAPDLIKLPVKAAE